MMVNWRMIGVGCFGGFLPDVIRIIQNRYKTELPEYLRTANFLLGLSALIILGGFAAWLGEAANIKQALAYGFAAPELISRLLSGDPIHMDRPTHGRAIRRFWAF